MQWSTPEVKQLNKELIRKEMQSSGECTKAKIARKTSLSIVTCNTLLNEMLEEKEIVPADEGEIRSGRPGRPASQYVYNVDYLHVLGIYVDTDASDFKIEYVVADAFGREKLHEKKYEKSVDYEYIEAVIEKVTQEDPLVKGISFGVPGVIDDGVVEDCEIESLKGVDIKGRIKEKFAIEAEVRNDMDFISYGIYSREKLKGDLATIFFPSEGNNCVGAGFIIDGKVINGFSHYSGELSYVAEAFGLSRQRQEEMMRDRSEFCSLVFKMVMTVIGTVDPEKIVLMGNNISSEERIKVWTMCRDVVSEKHIPDISIDNNVEVNYLKGLVRISLNKLQFPISVAL
ncbi:MAG TPA: ROK family protein [Candidatus Copromorpha excrementigallinarum]|uniref:ROK family protein n=1 Tax=Candidatus Allocopromorpha excrementigallinarum TaxID=2840742 RepID=A0A9D1I2E2_9FIRM|nr:ROK family protein [Candidatus Copromorpha excrementigallinarum]